MQAVEYARTGLAQLKVMLLKNFRLGYRGWQITTIELIAPIIAVLILLILQQVPAAANTDENPEPGSLYWEKCHGREKESKNCYPLFWTISDKTNSPDPLVESVMSILAAQTGFPMSNDTKNLPKQHIIKWRWETNSTDEYPPFYSYVKYHKNETQGGFVFYPSVNNQINFTLYWNSSCDTPFQPCKDYRPTIMNAISSAIVTHFQGDLNTVYNLTSTKYPITTPPNDAVKQYGIVMFFLGASFFFVILLYQIVAEKENKIRQGLRMMGLRGSMYWISWFIHSQVINLLSTLLIIATGNACDFAFFRQTNFFVLLLIFWVFITSMSHLAFFFATILPTTKQTIYISMTVVVIGVLLTIIFSLFGFGVFPLIYDGSTTGNIFKTVLAFLPMYNFAKAVFDVNSASYELGSASGAGFTWGDLYDSHEVNDGKTSLPPTIDSIAYNLYLTLGFSLLAWYCDNVIAGHGRKEPWWFPVSPYYWGIMRYQSKVNSNPVFEDEDGTESRELSTFKVKQTGVQIYDLRKTYHKYPFCKTAADVKALRGFSGEVNEGQILCLLGHNGAGKTTTINILTGLFPASFGDAFLYGYSVTAEMDRIRKVMGVCPQHDILWDELTAREHLQIFAELKGLRGQHKRDEVESRLESVGLTSVGNKLVGGFSGGMKRRLSVAIACIGDPSIIFLDEPTTGMDPKSKRDVWDLIQELKANRVIFLTTHSMEEADVLGDQIAIMSHGKVRCIGTSLHLKNTYGEGYRINVKANLDYLEDVKDFVADRLPDSKLIAETAEYLVYGLPHNCIAQIAPFFKDVEKQMEEGEDDERIIEDCSISHTTLEEVFLKITRQAADEFHREHSGAIYVADDDSD